MLWHRSHQFKHRTYMLGEICMLSKALGLVLIAVCTTTSQSTATDPFELVPLLHRPRNGSVISIVQHSFSQWDAGYSGSVNVSLLRALPFCRIILDMTGSAIGRQFDRYGMLWLNSVEVLRITTPEPIPAGIRWTVEKDVTIYQDIITRDDTLIVRMTLPNNVDATYTGVLDVSVTLTLYTPNEECVTPDLPIVLPVTAATTNIWNRMTNSESNEIQTLFSLPPEVASLSVRRVVLDVFASNHECEEFYYSNTPHVNASIFQSCPGGAYREIQVFINEAFAGAAVPFPVVYSGGMNPLLWRPIAGIRSLSLPSIAFDITPLYGSLLGSSNQPVNISVRVLCNSPTRVSTWLLDASLLVYTTNSGPYVINSTLDTLSRNVSSFASEEEDQYAITFYWTERHAYELSSTLRYSDGSSTKYAVRRAMESRSAVTLTDRDWLFVSLDHASTYAFSIGLETSVFSTSHRMFLADLYVSSDTWESLSGAINYGYQDCADVCVLAGIDAIAVYNTSAASAMRKSSSNAFYIERSLAGANCFVGRAAAEDGTRVAESAEDMCGGNRAKVVLLDSPSTEEKAALSEDVHLLRRTRRRRVRFLRRGENSARPR